MPPSPSQRALDETVIGGVPTTIGYHKLILATEDFVNGNVDTGFIASHADGEKQGFVMRRFSGGRMVCVNAQML